jgi:hypothetical protein
VNHITFFINYITYFHFMNYMCEILEDKKNLVKIDHLRVHPINLRTNKYLLQNP